MSGRWHFGKGLARTPDNFGLLGESPTHPELLDWLARRFTDQGWSLKRLHRQILLSSTWQLNSMASPMHIERDPENRLLGRAEVQRLEAEEIRDALIAVSGRLDQTMRGSLLTVKNRAYFFDHTSKDLTDYTSHRRSLYLPVVRNNVYAVFQLLDYPDAAIPTGDRTTTTVAPQALMMLNSDFAAKCSSELAGNAVIDSRDQQSVPRTGTQQSGRYPLHAHRRIPHPSPVHHGLRARSHETGNTGLTNIPRQSPRNAVNGNCGRTTQASLGMPVSGDPGIQRVHLLELIVFPLHEC